MPELVKPKVPEDVPVILNDDKTTQQSVIVDPTQVRRPWRSTARTVFQALVALATLIPFVVAGIYDGSADYPAVVTQVLGVAAGVSRVMALPQVEKFLRTFFPWLAAAPKS
jgi:hypothetical protein